MTGEDFEARFERQANQYAFPYHWLPIRNGRDAAIGRTLPWGLEYLAVLEATADLVTDSQPHRVLDLGCGDGRLTVELAERGVAEVVGIDLVDQAIAFARAFGAPFASQVHFERVPVQELDMGTFDVAVVMEVLEHIPDDDLASVIEATWQRVHGDGRLVVSVPTTNVTLIAKHERHYTEALLRTHLAPWFDVETVRYVHRTSGVNRVLRRLLTNRLASLEEPHLRRGVTELYRRAGWTAGPTDGAHLLAVCRKT